MLDGINVDGLFKCCFGYLICGAWVAILYSNLAQDACSGKILSMSHCLTRQSTGSGKILLMSYHLAQ